METNTMRQTLVLLLLSLSALSWAFFIPKLSRGSSDENEVDDHNPQIRYLDDDHDENKVALPPAVFYDEKRRLPLPEEDDDDENEVALPPAVFYDEKRRLPLPKDDDDDENKVALPPAVFYDEKRRLPLPAEDEDDENKVALPPAVFYDEKRRLPLPAEDDDDENKVAFPPAVFYDEKPDFQFRRTTTTMKVFCGILSLTYPKTEIRRTISTNTDIQKKKMMTTRTNRTVGEVPQMMKTAMTRNRWPDFPATL
ncbi:uncharacterized protein LOC112556776 [Pomacea canaliculata]|uniref:uncharacterized protein LOC112556776 n=1 Tax=Pomacea canaliculata TaxID=400727 RepID=UPI000D735437|nr:uncharacterized protein LOC112556776 [Pomacea canaliculata]